MMSRIGKKIREIRDELGLQQDEFGHRIGVSFQMVSAYENDKSKPSFKTIQKISDLSKKPLAWFFLGDGQRLEEDRAPTPSESLAAIRSHLDRLESEVAERTARSDADITWTDEMVHQLLKKAAESGQAPSIADLQALKGLATSVDELDIGEHSEMAARDDKKKRGKRKDEK